MQYKHKKTGKVITVSSPINGSAFEKVETKTTKTTKTSTKSKG